MRSAYTVVWDGSARDAMAQSWLDNPAIQREITRAVDEIDRVLSYAPASVGKALRGRTRLVVYPPVSVLYVIKEEDRQVRITAYRLWP